MPEEVRQGPIAVLLVEDDPAHVEAIRRALERAGTFAISVTGSLAESRRALAERAPDIVLADLNLSDGLALALLPGQHLPASFPLLVLTSHGDEETAVEAMRLGAMDYVVKSPETFAELGRTVHRALREWRLVLDRRAAQEALQRSEERFRVLFDLSPDAYLLVAESGLILDCNRAAEALTGLAHGALTGRALSTLLPAALAARLHAELSRDPRAHVHPDEAVLVRADDGQVPVEVSAAQVRLRDSTVVLTILRDISARKHAEAIHRKLEDQLHRVQKIDAIGQLAGGVAHDFNNALTAIAGLAELILHGLSSNDPLFEDMREIQQVTQRAGALTRQLLSFSRKQVVSPQLLDLNQLVVGAARMLRRLIGEDIDLVVRAGSDLGTVRVDPGQFEQVLTNLALNARDAMPHGGRLIVDTASVDVEEAFAAERVDARPGRHVRLSVCDSGCGMPPEVLARLFEPFFTTKERGAGTGLGLATVYGIVRQSGGFVTVRSEVGAGSTFEIYLPQIDAPADAIPVAHAPVDLPRGVERVLLVEDEDTVREFAGKVLRRLGYQVIAADRGAEALRLFEANRGIDLLLTDVVMPGMNGRELFDRLRAIRPDLRVLFMSGYTESIIAPRGVLEPGFHFIAKPFALEGLARKLREALSSPPPPLA